MISVNFLLFIITVSNALPYTASVENPTSIELAKRNGFEILISDLPKPYESNCQLVSFSLPKFVEIAPKLTEADIEYDIWEYKTAKKIIWSSYNLYYSKQDNRHTGGLCLPINDDRFKVNIVIKYDYPDGSSSGKVFQIEDLKKWYKEYIK